MEFESSNDIFIWHPRARLEARVVVFPGHLHISFCMWALGKGGQWYSTELNFSNPWIDVCANCGLRPQQQQHQNQEKEQFKFCARCRSFNYCSKKCQVVHWKAGHKVDCKGHWIEEFFPDIRNARK